MSLSLLKPTEKQN